jgi:hypothetical protein
MTKNTASEMVLKMKRVKRFKFRKKAKLEINKDNRKGRAEKQREGRQGPKERQI